MASVSIDSKEWQIGSSKVFIKSPESLFLLEEQRDRKYFSYAVLIQRAWRKYKSRKYFIEMRKKAADIMFDKKERKRFSLNREFLGDYLNLLDNPVLKALISTNDTNSDNKNEKTLFSDTVVKYDRSMKPIQREFLITDQHIFIIGAEKVKEGKLKGQLEKVVKRSIPFSQIEGVTMSTLCDDFFVLHVSGDFDNVMENVLKTELVTVLSQNYTIATSKTLNVKFQDMIPYTVKKTKWQSGGTFELRFIKDTTCKQAVVKNNGKSAEIRVAPGLPKDSRPTQKRYQENRGASSAPQKSQQSYQRPAMNPPVSRAPVAAVAATSNRPPNPSPSSLVGSTASISIASRAAALSSPSLPGSNARLATAVPTSSIPAANFSSNNALSAASTANSSTAALGVKASTNNVTSSTGSIMNLASVAAKKRAPPPPPGAKAKPKCKALYNYEATEADELAFRVGDIITIAGKDDPGWWTGTLDGKVGLFPANVLLSYLVCRRNQVKEVNRNGVIKHHFGNHLTGRFNF